MALIRWVCSSNVEDTDQNPGNQQLLDAKTDHPQTVADVVPGELKSLGMGHFSQFAGATLIIGVIGWLGSSRIYGFDLRRMSNAVYSQARG